MPFSKFEKNDIFYNKVKTFPKCDFIIYDSRVYLNNFKNDFQKFGQLHGTKQGFVSLYELNVDRVIDDGGSADPPAGQSIYPFITKGGSRIAFKTISTSEFDTTSQFAYGDIIKGKYPITSSIKRTRMESGVAAIQEVNNTERFQGSYNRVVRNKKYITALKNTFNRYIKLSHHYAYDANSSELAHTKLVNWDKSFQEMSLLEVPSIFYGSSMKKGSIVLQMYYTGSLMAECRDIKKNGELIQVSGAYNEKANNGKVAGVVLYNEGFLAMTGSWQLNADQTDAYVGTDESTPKWLHFARGANDGEAAGVAEKTAFKLSFEGVNYVPTLTMMAHMPKGLFNNSTNPTAFLSASVKDPVTSSYRYYEHQKLKFEKLEHQDYPDPTGSYDKQVYVSKVGIYDEQKRLIGVAKLANPVRKTENREYTFKLKLDF